MGLPLTFRFFSINRRDAKTRLEKRLFECQKLRYQRLAAIKRLRIAPKQNITERKSASTSYQNEIHETGEIGKARGESFLLNLKVFFVILDICDCISEFSLRRSNPPSNNWRYYRRHHRDHDQKFHPRQNSFNFSRLQSSRFREQILGNHPRLKCRYRWTWAHQRFHR